MKIILLVIIMLVNSISFANEPNAKRLLLSTLRNGDYAHAGDAEAIDLVLKQIAGINHQAQVLDVGCGFGGTLAYLKKQGFEHLYGIDINQDSINYAKSKYPDINFITLDMLKADSLDIKFDLIMLFNSIYAIQDKTKLLQVLNKIANPNAILVIFDYSSNYKETLEIKDFTGKTMYPIILNSFIPDLQKNNWKVIKTQDLSEQFITWYEQFLQKLNKEKSTLELKFLKTDIQQVQDSFSYFLSELKNKNMGGIVIYAQKK